MHVIYRWKWSTIALNRGWHCKSLKCNLRSFQLQRVQIRQYLRNHNRYFNKFSVVVCYFDADLKRTKRLRKWSNWTPSHIAEKICQHNLFTQILPRAFSKGWRPLPWETAFCSLKKNTTSHKNWFLKNDWENTFCKNYVHI